MATSPLAPLIDGLVTYKAWQQRVEEQILSRFPRTVTEESIPLRAVVQALVIVGIIATDVASGSWTSLWAAPVSIAGAMFSHARRKERNIPIKFLLAIAMLAALGFFFTNILGSLNDTRIALALLLIHLQVIHSFDLPRRKDLGYSMAIGLVLLAVAATLSETLSFAPWLILFIALTIPMLWLDERARLNLSPKLSGFTAGAISKIPWRLWGVSFLGVMALGGMIFVLLPRFPGYQLRTFPVSQTIPLPKDFKPARVNNPGYPSKAAQKGGSASAPGGKQAQETFNPDYYSGFNDRINLNLRGILIPRMVMRVRTQGASFLRMTTFDQYTRLGWQASEIKAVKVFRQEPFSVFYPPLNLVSGATGAVPTQRIVQTYSITANLPNFIPTVPWVKELYFPTEQVGIDQLGILHSPIDLSEGLTYTAISEVPIRDETQLRRLTSAIPAPIRNAYLQLPKDLNPAIHQQALAVTSKFSDTYSKSLALAQYLKQTYSLGPPKVFQAEVTESFLLKEKKGYPEHFATAYAVMLRSLGIPSRLVTGFMPGTFNAFTGYYEVWNTDATAIVEVYFPRYGWVAFDPVPGRPLIPPTPDKAQTFGVAEQTWNAFVKLLPSPVTQSVATAAGTLGGLLNGIFVWAGFLVQRLGWLGGLILGGGASALVFAGWGGVLGFKNWRYRRGLAKLAPAERVYQRMLDRLARQGFFKAAHQTPREFLETLRSSEGQVLSAITEAYVQWRYGGLPLEEPEARALTKQLEQSPWQGGRQKAPQSTSIFRSPRKASESLKK
jgi:protein-glutamine gamma-glutamyltransferase